MTIGNRLAKLEAKRLLVLEKTLSQEKKEA